MRRQFPNESSLYREADRIFTAAGSAAGIDLLIEIVRQDFGPEAANSVARRIVMPAHRSGGQAQFLERPVPKRPDMEIAPLLDRIRQDLRRPWPLSELAREARMSKRTFERRFFEATGTSPGKWLVAERVEAAKHILSATGRPMEEVAETVGIGSAHVLRHHFRRCMKLSPSGYRQSFATGKLPPM